MSRMSLSCVNLVWHRPTPPFPRETLFQQDFNGQDRTNDFNQTGQTSEFVVTQNNWEWDLKSSLSLFLFFFPPYGMAWTTFPLSCGACWKVKIQLSAGFRVYFIFNYSIAFSVRLYKNDFGFTNQTWAPVQLSFAGFCLFWLVQNLQSSASRGNHSLNRFAQLAPSAGPDDVGGSVVRGRGAWGGWERSWRLLGWQEVW